MVLFFPIKHLFALKLGMSALVSGVYFLLGGFRLNRTSRMPSLITPYNFSHILFSILRAFLVCRDVVLQVCIVMVMGVYNFVWVIKGMFQKNNM